MTLFYTAARRFAMALLGIAMLAGFLLLGGCSDSTTGSAYGSGDKKNDPALKALSQEKLEVYKSKGRAIKGNPVAAKRRS
jgi:hypothetical protein